MNNTKEKILTTALQLFATDGYEAVSVSDIAGQLGITKGALYKHYVNKRDIFESIVKRMYELDETRSDEFGVPKDNYDVSPDLYNDISIESVKNFTVAQLEFWTENEFARNFRRMLTLEQYRNAEIAELYRTCIGEGPVNYMKDIFVRLAESGIIKNCDAETLAIEYYAPLYLLFNIYDNSADKSRAKQLLIKHVNDFFERIK